MAKEAIAVRVEDLHPGDRILQITRLSAEYSYLDSKTLDELKKRFEGATAEVQRRGTKQRVGIEALERGEHLTSICDLPSGSAYDAADEATLRFLKEWGFREVLAIPGAKPLPASPPTEAAPGRKTAARSGTERPPREELVSEARQFLERVDQAERLRENAAEMVQELFHQGRVGRFSARPAVEMVEHVLTSDAGPAMTAVAGLKSSDQTYAHCVDMAVILSESARELLVKKGEAVDDKIVRSTLAAGFMHDIGKCKIPREILDSTERFAVDSPEMAIMRSHVSHSAKILSDAGMNAAMINVAHYHHVKADTSLPNSYPDVAYSEVIPLTRLASIVDVYQALIGRRSYKRNWVPGNAVGLLRKLQGSEFDEGILNGFLSVIGLYPVGSLVRLSSGDLGFVIQVAGQALERPVVILAENANGERLASNPLVDLMAETDLHVTEVVDHYEYYAEHPNQAFDVFRSLRVA